MKKISLLLLLVASFARADTATTLGVTTGSGANLCTETTGSGCHNEVVVVAPSKVTSKTIAQKTLSGSTATVILGSSTTCNGMTVKALPGNAVGGVIYVGYSSGVTTANGFPLSPRDSQFFAAPASGNCQEFYIIGTSGDGVAVVTQ